MALNLRVATITADTAAMISSLKLSTAQKHHKYKRNSYRS